jgi:hypothetical protein
MRFLRIATGYLVAVACAGFAPWLFIDTKRDGAAAIIGAIPLFALAGMVYAVPLTILQFTLVITLGEKYRIRSLWYYALTGALAGMTAILPIEAINGGALPSGVLAAMAPAGALCGGVYWLIAGRQAGEPSRAGVNLGRCAGLGLTAGIVITACAGALASFIRVEAAALVLVPVFALSAVLSAYVFCLKLAQQGAA